MLKKYKYTFLFGLLAGLAFPPFYLIFFLPISLCYLLEKLCTIGGEKKPHLTAFIYGTVFGFGYFLTQLYWISFSLFVDFKTYFWLFPFAVSLIPIACAVYLGCTTLLFFFLVKKFSLKNKFLIAIVFAACYTIFEYLRGIIFPWNLFAYTLGFSDILSQSAAIINIYILDFLLVVFFCFGYVLFPKPNRYTIIYISFLTILITFGAIRLHNATPIELGKKFRLVQANIPQTLKWERDEIERNLSKYLELTFSDGYDAADIIVWAESSIPYLLTEDSGLGGRFGRLSEKILITGAIRGEVINGEVDRVWNSIFLFQNGKVYDFYDKFILVPFGEYIPLSKYIPFIKKITAGDAQFSKGNGNHTVTIVGIKISPLICYEIIFPNSVINKNNRPDVIINLTNDGWFGYSSGPYQHLVAAKFRAIENKIPVIRVSNSGISAYIDEYGRISKSISLRSSGILDI